MITISRKMHIITAEIVLDFSFLKSQLCAGENIITSITPKIRERRIGFKRKKERAARIASTEIKVIFLK